MVIFEKRIDEQHVSHGIAYCETYRLHIQKTHLKAIQIVHSQF